MENEQYYTRSKFMNNFAFVYSKEELDRINADERQKLNVYGRFNEINF